MALGQVAARTEGDFYQGLYFWHRASALFIRTSKVVKVMFENDAASGVDDVSVFYEPPGINDEGNPCIADHYQIKYHVDQSDSYSANNLIDPAFIKAKTSLLQKFKKAYDSLPPGQWFRLTLVSNWTWEKDDELAKSIRAGGALSDEFFKASPRSNLGKIREKWRNHLGINESIFEDFARRLRFGLNELGRTKFEEWVNDRLGHAGLKIPTADKRLNPYVGLYTSFVMDKTNEFTPTGLWDLCVKEGLIDNSIRQKSASVIGIRSFMHCAENMEDETDSFICVSKYFEGRYIKKKIPHWTTKVACEVAAFLKNSISRDKEYHILLDCHSSLGFLAGYTLDQKSGVNAYPIQKGIRTSLWQPAGQSLSDAWQLVTDVKLKDPKAPDCVVALSLTRDVSDDVENYITSQKLKVHTILKLSPKVGPGQGSITDADHAIQLAELSMQEANKYQKKWLGVTHIFAAAPNGFMFFLGRYRGPMRKVQLYEYDFEGERGGTYMPSIALPLST